MYCSTGLDIVGYLTLVLDGSTYVRQIQLNGTACSDGITPDDRENMDDGDHQLTGRVSQLNGTFFYMEYLECVCPCPTPSQVQCADNLAASRIQSLSGDGFDLLSTGPTAQNVPAQAVIVDNTDPGIIYHNESRWLHYSDSAGDYRRSVSYGFTKGTALSYSFDGVAIWYDSVSHAIQ